MNMTVETLIVTGSIVFQGTIPFGTPGAGPITGSDKIQEDRIEKEKLPKEDTKEDIKEDTKGFESGLTAIKESLGIDQILSTVGEWTTTVGKSMSPMLSGMQELLNYYTGGSAATTPSKTVIPDKATMGPAKTEPAFDKKAGVTSGKGKDRKEEQELKVDNKVVVEVKASKDFDTRIIRQTNEIVDKKTRSFVSAEG